MNDIQSLLIGSVDAAGVITPSSCAGTNNTVLGTNTYGLQAKGNLANSGDIYGLFTFTTGVLSGTSVEMQIIGADNAGMSINVEVLGTTGAIPIAQCGTGITFRVALNSRGSSLGKQYISCRIINVGTMTGENMIVFLDADPVDQRQAYPSGYTVL